MASAPIFVIVYALLVGGLAILGAGAAGAVQWLRLGLRGHDLSHDGSARIDGRIRTRDEALVVEAPMTAEPAVCVEWVLEREAGKLARPVWRPVETGSERVPMVIATDAGTITVNPADAALALDVDETKAIEGVGDLPANLPAAADALKNAENGRFRLVERRLEPGDPVSATGVLATDDGSLRLRGPAVPRLIERVLAVPFVIADRGRDDGAGLVRDRAIAGFVLGLPPTLLALVLLFPP